jgi:hypothetical protein
MHIGWVPNDSGGGGGGYHAQMAVLVKPNGRFGKAYMAAIKPFRYAFVYPLLLQSIVYYYHRISSKNRYRHAAPWACL